MVDGREGADGPGAVDHLLAEFARWTADERAGEAARSRTRERWLRQQAVEAARLAGVALDLAERRAAVIVRTSAGRTHRGRLAAVGSDFWMLATDAGHPCLISVAAVGSLRVAAGAGRPSWDPDLVGDRDDVVDMTMGDALAIVAADRPRVALGVRGDAEVLTGELRAVGIDVLTLRSAGQPPSTAYVPLSSVTECSIFASG
jgi:hypothetical protein